MNIFIHMCLYIILYYIYGALTNTPLKKGPMGILSTNFPHLDEGLVLHGILASRVSQLVDVDHPACGAPREGPGRKDR